MKSFKKVILLFLGLFLLILLIINISISHLSTEKNKTHYIEMNRIASHFMKTDHLPTDFTPYQTIASVSFLPITLESKEELPTIVPWEYEENTMRLYWPVYEDTHILRGFLVFVKKGDFFVQGILPILNFICLGMGMLFILFFLYFYITIMRPLKTIEHLSFELGKGNMNPLITTFKSPYFKGLRTGLNLLNDEWQHIEEKNLTLERERHTLLASIAHGIKTPVSTIMLYAASINENIYPPNQSPKIATKIIHQAENINELVKKIIQTSSQTISSIEICKKDFYLQELTQKILSNYTDKLHLQRIEFELTSCDNFLLYSDSNAIFLMLSNLIDNAIKYGDGHFIHVSIETEEDSLYCHVTNSGTPIATSELPHLFTCFHRGSNAEQVSGNGLGLYICKTIATKLGGHIYATSYATTNEFIIVLPIN